MSLRRFLTVGLFFLFICGCLTATALWYSTRESAIIIDKLTDSVESANVAHLVQRSLSTHRRQLLLKSLAGQGEHRKQNEKTTEDLIRNSRHLTDLISTPDEKGYVEIVQGKIVSYLKNYETLQKKGVPPGELYQSLSPRFDETQDAIQDLMRFNIEEAIQLQSESTRQNTLNYALVGLSLTLFVIVLLILLFGLKEYFFNPILELGSIIEKFELGTHINSSLLSGASEIKSIASSFVKMSSRLLKQKEMQLMFVSSVAHDLRNPMSAISMATEIASEDPNMTGQSKELLLVIKRQSGHLNRLISDLMDTTRIESGHLELSLETCDLRSILKDAVLLHSSLSPIHKIVLEIPEEPVPVSCDHHRMSQVFNNLLSNAIKYSPQGGSVWTRLKLEGGNAIVSISDQGVGIPTEEIDGIFEPFRRSSLSRNSIPGVGLGLSAAKKIITAHDGGEIYVKSTVNVGTEVSVKLKAMSDLDSRRGLRAPSALTERIRP